MSSTWGRRLAAALTIALHLVALWLYLSSGLVAPLWAIVVLLVLWVLFAWGAVVVFRRYGAVAVLIPIGAIALWFLVLTVGEQLLGWTA